MQYADVSQICVYVSQVDRYFAVISPPPSGSLKTSFFFSPTSFSLFCKILEPLMAHTGNIVQFLYKVEDGMSWRRKA